MFDSSRFRYPWSKSPKESPKKTFSLTFIIGKKYQILCFGIPENG